MIGYTTLRFIKVETIIATVSFTKNGSIISWVDDKYEDYEHDIINTARDYARLNLGYSAGISAPIAQFKGWSISNKNYFS